YGDHSSAHSSPTRRSSDLLHRTVRPLDRTGPQAHPRRSRGSGLVISLPISLNDSYIQYMQSKLLDAPTSLRIAGAAGIGFAVLIVSGNLVLVPAGMPSPGSPPDEAIDFFLSPNEPTGAVSMFLPAVWALATLFAAGALAAVLRAGGPAGWAYTGFAGVLLQN